MIASATLIFIVPFVICSSLSDFMTDRLLITIIPTVVVVGAICCTIKLIGSTVTRTEASFKQD